MAIGQQLISTQNGSGGADAYVDQAEYFLSFIGIRAFEIDNFSGMFRNPLDTWTRPPGNPKNTPMPGRTVLDHLHAVQCRQDMFTALSSRGMPYEGSI